MTDVIDKLSKFFFKEIKALNTKHSEEVDMLEIEIRNLKNMVCIYLSLKIDLH